MLITNHVLAGATIGARSTSTRTAFLIGLVSHVVMDAIPHWGPRDRRSFLTVAVVDGLVGAAAAAAITALAGTEGRGRVVAGMLGATLPDADKPCTELFGASPFPAWVDRAHRAIQTESPSRLGQEFLVAGLGTAVLAAALRRSGPVTRRR